MIASAGNLDRFVRRVYRRLVILRTAEAGGIGLLGGAAAALAMAALASLRGQEPMLLVGLSLGVGAVGGLLWAILRQPKVIDAAIEADRQLGLADLLSTACTLSHQRSDPFADAVLAVAEHRCASLSPAAVILNRLGARAWGGIGLATALALTVGLMAGNPADAPAATQTHGAMALAAADRAATRAARAQSGGSSVNAPRIAAGFPGAQENGFNPARDTATVAQKAGAGGSNATDHGNPDSAGTGSGTSKSGGRAEPLRVEAGNSAGSSGNGVAAGGMGAAGATRQGQDDAGSRSMASASIAASAAPWASASWSLAQEQAAQAIQSGRISAEYRDLVRAYFERR